MRIAIIHDTKETPDGNWFQGLASNLKKLGREVFDRTFGQLSKDVILIGHSIGAMFCLRLLVEAPCQITATFLVAGLE